MSENPKTPPKGRRVVYGCLLAAIVVIVVAGILFAAEMCCKRGAASPEKILAWKGGGGDYFMYDPTLGWRGTPDAAGLHRSRVTISHNGRGFRDTAWDLNTRKPRVLLLGDSNMWGYGVEDDEYPCALLNRMAPHVRWFNAGMNGYGTDQEYLLFLELQPIVKPDWTVLVVCGNDRTENTSKRVRTYNKPYFTIENNELALQNVPVPRSEKTDGALTPLSVRVFRKTRSYLLYTIAERIEAKQSRDAVATTGGKHIRSDNSDPTHALIQKMFDKAEGRLIVVPIKKDEELETFCQENTIPFLDLSETRAGQPGPLVYPAHFPKYGHWTPEGNKVAADHICKAVLSLLDPKGAK